MENKSERKYNQHEQAWRTVSGWFALVFLITLLLKLLTIVSIPWLNIGALFGISMVCGLYSGWHYNLRTKKE